MTTPRLGITPVVEGQAQAEIPINAAFNILDFFTNCTIKNRTTATPPGSPTAGDCYLVAASPTGAWSGMAGKLAAWDGGSWVFCTVQTGQIVYDVNAADLRFWNGTAWKTITFT